MLKKLISNRLWIFLFVFCTIRGAFSAPLNQPKYVVFLVHGLAGDKSTFGDLQLVLQLHLAKYKPQYDVRVEVVEYPSGSSNEMDAFAFTEYLDKQIANAFEGGKALNSRDRFAIVAHSQGGLVSLLWFIANSQKNSGMSFALTQHLDSFVSLGTPFWGSNAATFLHYDIEHHIQVNLPDGKVKDELLNMIRKQTGLGQKEVREMRYGSNTNYYLRKIAMDFDKIQGAYTKNVPRIHNVVGVLPTPLLGENRLGFLGASALGLLGTHLGRGPFIFETDLAVPVSSAHINFFYYKEETADQRTISANEFQLTHFSRDQNESSFSVIPAPHTSFLTEYLWQQSMTSVPSECIRFEKCEHISYPIILANLLHCPKDGGRDFCPGELLIYLNRSTKVEKKSLLSSFNLDITINLPRSINCLEPIENLIPYGKRSNLMI